MNEKVKEAAGKGVLVAQNYHYHRNSPTSASTRTVLRAWRLRVRQLRNMIGLLMLYMGVIMKRIIAIFGVGLACAIAMSSGCAAAEDNVGHQSSVKAPFVVAAESDKPPQAKQPTDADKKALELRIQGSYKPTRVCTQSKAQIGACAAACAAKCIFGCFPSFSNAKGPDSEQCHSCVNQCMDKCTGCGT
jgi:hypothetical protein